MLEHNVENIAFVLVSRVNWGRLQSVSSSVHTDVVLPSGAIFSLSCGSSGGLSHMLHVRHDLFAESVSITNFSTSTKQKKKNLKFLTFFEFPLLFFRSLNLLLKKGEWKCTFWLFSMQITYCLLSLRWCHLQISSWPVWTAGTTNNSAFVRMCMSIYLFKQLKMWTCPLMPAEGHTKPYIQCALVHMCAHIYTHLQTYAHTPEVNRLNFIPYK